MRVKPIWKSQSTRALCCALVLLFAPGQASADTADALARRLAQRIATHVDATTLGKMAAAIQAGDFEGAAKLATATSGYGDVFLFNLVAPMCSLLQNPNVSQSPCVATLQYIAWNNKPWTDAVTGNYYAFFSKPGLPVVSRSDNSHYDQATSMFLQGQMSYVSSLAVTSQSISDTMGVLTLPQAVVDAASAGTNRRFVQLLFRSFLGLELNDIRDPGFAVTVASDIRQDVYLGSPDADTLVNSCMQCHGGIDRVAAAFNFLDYNTSTSQLVAGSSVVQKLLDRETAAAGKLGFVESRQCSVLPGQSTCNATSGPRNAWRLNWKTDQVYGGSFAWGATSGVGVNSLGRSVAATLELRINVVRRIWKLACGHDAPSSELPTVTRLAQYMQTTAQDQVTPVVWQVATLPQCLGR